MSMNLVLNDSSPTPAPTNGCCASVTDIAAPAKIAMTPSGTVGSSSSSITPTTSSATAAYYIGTPGDYGGLSFNAGTWTIPFHTFIQSTVILDSVWISQADSSGNCKATIGSSTGLALTLVKGVNTITISTSASATFGASDVVIISFQLHSASSSPLAVYHDQTVTTPATTSSGTTVLYQAVAGRIRNRTAPPDLVNQFSGNVIYSAVAGRIRNRTAPPALSMDQVWTAQPGRIRHRNGAPSLSSTGTIAYQAVAGRMRHRGSPPGAITPLTATIRFRRGPSPAYPPPGMPEGMPYLAGILTGTGTQTFEILFCGGHDGQNKAMGGAMQVGAGSPGWTPGTDGSWAPYFVDETNLKLWVYVAGAWHYALLT